MIALRAGSPNPASAGPASRLGATRGVQDALLHRDDRKDRGEGAETAVRSASDRDERLVSEGEIP